MARLGILLSLCLFAFLPASAQQLQYRAQHYSLAEGLPHARVRCLLQDSRGFLWIGTENGLSRYDGRLYVHYFSSEGEDRISGNYITALLEDRDSILWIATLDGGLTRLDPRCQPGRQTEVFFHVPGVETSLPVNRLNCLFDYDQQYLMIGGEQAPVIFLHKATRRFLLWTGTLPVHPQNARSTHETQLGWVHSMTRIDAHGVLLTFLNSHQVWAIDTRDGRLRTDFGPAVPLAGDNTYTQLAYDDSSLYAGGWQTGITRWARSAAGQSTRLPVPDEVNALLWIGPQQLLAGTQASGLFEVDIDTRQAVPVALHDAAGDPLEAGRVNCLLRDSGGRLWAGTHNGLLQIFPPATSTPSGPLLPTEAGRFIFQVQPTQARTALIFTSSGLYAQKKEQSAFEAIGYTYRGQPLSISRLAHTPSFGLIMATESGLFFADTATRRLKAFPPLRLEVDMAPATYDFFQVRDVFEDTVAGRPVLVAGVLGYGVILIDLTAERLYLLIQQPGCDTCIGNNLVRKMIRDGKKGYWVATSRGLYHWDIDDQTPGGVFTSYHHEAGLNGKLSSDDLMDMVLDEDGVLWIATRNGLNALQQDSITHYPFPLSRGNLIYAIVPVSERELLISSSAGTGLFDKEKRTYTHVIPMGKSGIAEWRAGAIMEAGSVLLAGENHWLRLPLDSLKKAHEPPHLYLAHFAVNGQTREASPDLGLRYRDYFEVQLSALHIHHARDYRIQYQWAGNPASWQFAPEDGVLFVAHPRPGSHVLHARLVGNDGKAYGEQVLLSLRVSPPFWRSPVFLLTVATTLFLALYALHSYRLYQQQQRQAMRLRIASDLHDEIGSALGSIFMGSELAGKFLRQDPLKSETVLASIRNTANETLRNMADMIWVIHPRQDHGEKITAKMQQVARELLLATPVQIHFEFDPAIDGLTLPMEMKRNLLLIYKEALYNVARHAEATRVEVHLGLQSRQLRLQVRDDGKGFVMGTYAGNGLENMRYRAAAMGGRLEIETAPGKGTCMGVWVKV